jgi:hypothetical protein
MKPYVRILFLAGLLGLVLGIFVGCKEDPPTGLYDLPRETPRPQPVITSVDPPAVALAGVTDITITGSNFSTVKEENFVYFDASLAPVLSASATQLVVRAPVLVKDSISLRATVYKGELFSAARQYKLLSAVDPFGGLGKVEEAYGITADRDGNIYVSIVAGGTGAGVRKITPAGVKTDYSPATPGVTRWSGMKIGPGGVLYTARILKVIYQIPAGGGAAAIWVTGSSIGTVYDLDFDADGNCWAVGNNTSVYRVKQDKSIKPFAFTGNLRAVRIYNGYIYLGGKVDTTEGVWRAQIVNADSLGTFEKYFDFTAKYSSSAVNALTFAADGDMYIGTDAAAAIVVVHPSKVSEPLYPGLFTPTTFAFTWGLSDDMYAVRTVNTPAILKLTMLKNGAPYYGRQL